MRLLITDSGVGGLSVCAYAERYLRMHPIGMPVELIYVNASPENDFGYNSMGSRQEKIDNFDEFLDIVTDTYSPDQIYVACNTLSVLYSDTPFSKAPPVPVRGIVESGVSRLVRDLERFPESVAAIFGTPTTIDEDTYPRLLQSNGIGEERIISQACPSLADTISEDREGSAAREKIERYVGEAIAKSRPGSTDFVTYLACTHYGYRKDYFSGAFGRRRTSTRILNPNEFVSEELFANIGRTSHKDSKYCDVGVEFITRYRVPETALETIAFFLEGISPKTVDAFQTYTYAPDLF
ncbi:MAG: hypothetical protein P8127_01580 [Acidobacteriota bacterium]